MDTDRKWLIPHQPGFPEIESLRNLKLMWEFAFLRLEGTRHLPCCADISAFEYGAL
jgi:hypothetical protein